MTYNINLNDAVSIPAQDITLNFAYKINIGDEITITGVESLVPTLAIVEIARDKVSGKSRTYWAFSFYGSDFSNCFEIRSAPVIGYLCLEKVTLYSASALTVTLGEGKSVYDSGEVGKLIIGPVEISKEVEVGTAANEEHFISGCSYEFDFTGPDGKDSAKLVANKALTLLTSAAGGVAGIIYGFTEGI